MYHFTWRLSVGTKGSLRPVRVLRRRSWPEARGPVEGAGGCQGWRLAVAVGGRKVPDPERDMI